MNDTSFAGSISRQIQNQFSKFKESSSIRAAQSMLSRVVDWFQTDGESKKKDQPKSLRFETFEARCVLSATHFYPQAPEGGDDGNLFESDANIPVFVDGDFEFGDLNAQFPYGKENTFKLESNPTATKTIYLDFDGYHSRNNWWNHNIVFPAFDRDGDAGSFSDAELSEIQKQFLHVVEDFLPFNVNVTTQDPGVEALRKSGAGDNRWGVRAVNTQYTNGFGNGTGGIAHLNSFDAGIDNPIFSFNKGARNGGMTNSHEIGHALGLSHDGLNGSTYHPGVGSGETSWGPIMGAPFGKNLVQWSKGEYAGSTTTQDDLQIITRNRNGFGFRADDHGNSTLSATPLDVVDDTDVSSWGIIERNTDQDFFSFSSGPGSISIDISALTFNPSLDVEAKLFNSAGQVLATSNPANLVGASFNMNLTGGTYYISVDGIGKPGVYTDYGSLGYYEISGVVVDPVNDLPTLNPIDDLILEEDAPEQTVFLTGITAGNNETQPLRVTSTSTNIGLIPNPDVNYSSPDRIGFLKFTPVGNKNGTATITVTVEDGGLDLDLSTTDDNATFTQTFQVIVNPVNDPPTLNPIEDMIINEDAGQQTVSLQGISDGDEGEQPLKVTASSSNTGLIPNPTVNYTSPSSIGNLQFTPAADQFGMATITVVVEDGGDDKNLATPGDNLTFTRTFTVRVNAVNDKPTLASIPNQTLMEDELRSLGLSGITAGGGETQPLMVSATSSNQSVMANPVVDYTSDNSTGMIHLVPHADAVGSTIITVTVEDGGLDGDLSTKADNAIYVRTFGVDVDPVNDLPTLLDLNDVDLLEDAGLQEIDLRGISAGSGESQPLKVTATSSNTTLVSIVDIDYTSPSSTGLLSFESNADRFGTTVITVTVEDGGLDGNLATTGDNATFSRMFTVTVDPVNDAPRFVVPQDVQEDRSKGLSEIRINGINAGPFENQPVQFSVSTDSPGFISNLMVDYTDPNNTGKLTFDAIDQLGRGKIFLTLEDGGLDGDLSTKADNAMTLKVIDVLITTKKVSFASTDVTQFGFVEGTYGDTYWRNRSSQQITETSYRNGTRSRLEHRWKIDIAGPSVSTEFFVYAGHNSTNEQFKFQYKVNGTSTWKDLFTTNQNASKKYYARVMDQDLENGGTLWIRARDTNRGDDAELATLNVQKINVLNRGLTEIVHSVNAFVFDRVAAEEGQDKAQIRFQLADRTRLSEDFVVHYEVGGTAEDGDYREVLTGTKIIRAGNLMARLNITPNDDRLMEGNESLTVKILPQSHYRITGSPMASVKILDNDKMTYEATGEVSYLGSHQVHYPQTFYADNQTEIISEKSYGNKTMLNHQWRINTEGQTQLTLEGRFEVVDNPFVDTFQVSYSTDQQNWKSLGRLQYGSPLNLQTSIQVSPGDQHVWVRVHDRYRQAHDTHRAQVAVSHLRLVKENVGSPGLRLANHSLSTANTELRSFVSTSSPVAPSALLTGHQESDAFNQSSENEFILPEFYSGEEDQNEVDIVFGEWAE